MKIIQTKMGKKRIAAGSVEYFQEAKPSAAPLFLGLSLKPVDSLSKLRAWVSHSQDFKIETEENS